MHLRSRRIVQTENEPTIIEEEENNELEEAPKKTVNPNPAMTINKESSSENEKTPPYPEHLAIAKTEPQPEFYLNGELKNLYVKIPLLQVIRDIPIYTKAIRVVCVKKPGRKPKDPPTVYVMGGLSELLQGETPLVKYGDPSNPTITIQIDQVSISNTLVDLGAAINIMTCETLKLLGLKNL